MVEYKIIKLEDVNIDYAAQPRDNGLDADHVSELEAAYQSGEPIEPPVVWFLPDETYWLSQGYHRTTAMKRAGLKQAKFRVRTGNPDEWYEDAQASNQGHGLKRSNADKRKAALNMVRRFPKRSDRAIAEKLGIHHDLVASCRRELAESASSPPPATRIGRDG